MPWQELKLRIPASALARAEALLGLAGAISIAISDAGDAPLFEPAPGTTPLWPTLCLRALFDTAFDRSRIALLIDALDASEVRIATVDESVVERALLQRVQPLEIGPRLRLVAADDPSAPDRRTLRLAMGLAFGTGRHPTTRLCLEWIEREIGTGDSVLDFGTGSGVLALAALKLGASRACAVDTDPQALVAAARNAALNGFESKLRLGDSAAIDAGEFDVILANVLAGPLLAHAPELAARQKARGRIVLSGILLAQADGVAAAYERWYEPLERRERDGWVLLTGRRRSGYDR